MDKDIFSIANLYIKVATKNASLPALIRDDVEITHGELLSFIKSFVDRLKQLDVDRNGVVALNSGDTLVVLCTIMATSILGAKFVSASPVLAKFKPLRPTHFFRTKDARGKKGVDFQVIDESWLFYRDNISIADQESNRPPRDQDWIYVHTTGTTGKPKFIVLTEQLVLDRSAAVASDFPYRETVLATTFSVTSRPFFARAIATLLNAGAICDGKEIEFWKKSGVNLVCGAPGQLEYLFKDAPAGIRFDRVESSGAHLPEHFIPKLLDHFETVVNVYGATETNKSFETIYRRGDDGHIIKTPNPRDSVIEIVSPEGNALGAGKIGSVRVRNSYLANGYMNDPVATAKSFRDGWFYPGDLAAWGEKGELMIVGREDDVINIGGYKMNAGMLDMFFKRIPGIVDAIAFNNPKIDAVNKVLVFAVFEDEHRKNEVIANACELATTQMKFLLVPSCIRSVRSIPRTEAGDPDRQACRKMVAQRAEIEIDDDQI